MAEPPRRFPTPWPPDNVPGGCVVRDATGQTLACLYGRETEADARQAKVLMNDEPRRIAVDIARLLELLGSRIAPDPSALNFLAAPKAHPRGGAAFAKPQLLR
jgi:hypothetical protein